MKDKYDHLAHDMYEQLDDGFTDWDNPDEIIEHMAHFLRDQMYAASAPSERARGMQARARTVDLHKDCIPRSKIEDLRDRAMKAYQGGHSFNFDRELFELLPEHGFHYYAPDGMGGFKRVDPPDPSTFDEGPGTLQKAVWYRRLWNWIRA